MKRIVTFLALWAICLAAIPCLGADQEQADKAELTTFNQKLGYAMGSDVGKYFKGLGKDIDFPSLLKGVTDGYSGADLAMSPDDIVSVQKEFGSMLQERQAAELEQMKEKNKTAGMAFLAENKKKKGVSVTDSGLQYEFIKKGDGATPKESDQVKVDYVGRLIDGTEFDSSIKRGEPAVFGVNQVIPGWSEALQLIPVGSKVRLVIPSELAYGEQGVMPRIEPNSVLVFEVDLLGIEPSEGAADNQ
ncbi:MAG: FKBP-type peptidyl-prolyl cis-trans isomerase [Desulfopila sp.]